jgi:hypothetical protein
MGKYLKSKHNSKQSITYPFKYWIFFQKLASEIHWSIAIKAVVLPLNRYEYFVGGNLSFNLMIFFQLICIYDIRHLGFIEIQKKSP